MQPMALQWHIMPMIGTLPATDWVRVLYSSQTSVISISNDCNMLMINFIIYCTEKILGWWGAGWVGWGDVGTFLPRLLQFWSQLVRTAEVFIVVLDKFQEIITETFSFCFWSVCWLKQKIWKVSSFSLILSTSRLCKLLRWHKSN